MGPLDERLVSAGAASRTKITLTGNATELIRILQRSGSEDAERLAGAIKSGVAKQNGR